MNMLTTLADVQDELRFYEGHKKSIEFRKNVLGSDVMVEEIACDKAIRLLKERVGRLLATEAQNEEMNEWQAFIGMVMRKHKMMSVRATEELMEIGGRKEAYEAYRAQGMKAPEVFHMMFEKGETHTKRVKKHS